MVNKTADSTTPNSASGPKGLGQKLKALLKSMRKKPALKAGSPQPPAAKRAAAVTLEPRAIPNAPAAPAAPAASAASPVMGEWTPNAIELLQEIWGKGWNVPMGDDMAGVLVRAVGLTKEMSVLDLSAGLGGTARKIHADYKTYVTGLEPDAELARLAGEESKLQKVSRTVSITHYDPESYEPTKRYDCIVARELFFRIKNKARFIRAVAESLKEYGQVSWTDFLVEANDMAKPEIAAWLAREDSGATPMSLKEVTDIWGKLGYDLRIAEDRSAKYKHAVLLGLNKFLNHLQKQKLGKAAKPGVLREIELWALRIAAMEQGMRFYRFCALKK